MSWIKRGWPAGWTRVPAVPAVLACVAGLSVCAAAAAQNYSISRMLNGRIDLEGADDSGDESGDSEGAMGGFRMGGGRGGDQELVAKFKSDLAKQIATQDFTRTPQTVLGARVKLAAKARARAMDPDADKKEQAELDAGAGGEGEDGGDSDDGPRSPEEMLRRMMEGQGGAAPESGADRADLPDGAAEEPGAVQKAQEAKKAKAAAQARARAEAGKFRLLVVSGDWVAVGDFLKGQTDEVVKKDAPGIYLFMLGVLQNGDSALVPEEVLAVSEASPGPLTDKEITKLGELLRATKSRGSDASVVAARIRTGTTHFGGDDPAKRKNAASLLVAAGLSIDAVAYLAPLEQARRDQDADLLNLHGAYFRALSGTQQGVERQASARRGWDLCREVLALPKASSEARARALDAAFAVLGEVPSDDADAWLASLFVGDPDIGWKAIDLANTRAIAQFQRQGPVEARLKALAMVRRLGSAVLTGAGEGVAAWRPGLNMLTMSILTEAEATRSAQGRQMSDEMRYGGYMERQFQPIPSEQLGAVLPDARWLTAIDPGLAAKFEIMVAATTAGSGDTAGVLEMIRPVAASDPKRALKLAEALLSSWGSFARSTGGMNDDPYSSMYARQMMYGGSYRSYGRGYGGAGAIPLTRAMQRRNLEKLRTVLAELGRLGVGPLAPKDVADAFAVSHSEAEVYNPEDIEAVFGPIDSMGAAARLKLAESMRQRLGTIWRNPEVQQRAGTKRTDRELVAEVTRGYQLALGLVPDADAAGDDDWAAATAGADLAFDLAEFLYGQKADLATYSELRQRAFAGYRRGAELYGRALGAGRVQPTARVFVQWFSSSLGASDLGFLTRQDRPDADQTRAVIDAIAGLPDGQARRHTGLFASQAAQSMREMNPELKVRFARHAIEVVGDHPEGATLRKLVAFYDDLEKEVELNVSVDGPTDVGPEPFGVQIAVWSSRAVARESGGFSKYLRNEQWHPQTGQPVNYKDDFEKKLREAFSERFEILAAQFHKPEVQPMSIGRRAWEQFPLVYLLVRAKDPSVDRLPQVKLDMDFTDGQGTVILPVASGVAMINASGGAAPRSVGELSVEQVLDDRALATERVARLAVNAKGRGMISSLDTLLDLSACAGFVVSKSEDHGVTVSDLDVSGGTVVPVIERSWSLELRPDERATVEAFTYPRARHAALKLSHKRFSDADVVDVGPVVAVGPIAPQGRWKLWAGAGAAGVLGVAALAWYRRRHVRTVNADAPLFHVPAAIDPVNSIGVLRRILAQNGRLLSPAEQAELSSAIEGIERRFFAPGTSPSDGEDPELRSTVGRWVQRANQ